MLGVDALTVRVAIGPIDEIEHDIPVPEIQGGLDAVGQASARVRAHRESIHDNFDGVLLLLLESRYFVEAVHHTVHANAREALGLQLPEDLRVFALALANERRKHLEPRLGWKFEHLIHDLLRRLPADRIAAHRAVRLSDPGVQQAQVVVHLGDGPHR